jgi:Family of unknown function (DUF6498)
MGRVKKNKARVIMTEDAVRAEAIAAEARIVAQSETAVEHLTAVSRDRESRNPFSIGSALLQPVWMCSVALYGLLAGGWSPASVMVCFWFEKLTRVTLMAAQIYIHRETTRKRGHYRLQHANYTGGSQRRRKTERAVPGSLQPVHLHEDDDIAARGKLVTSGSLLAQFVAMSVVAEVLTLGVMLWVLSSMDEWTQAASGWAFVKQEWMGKAWIIVIPLVLHFVIDTVAHLRKRSFVAVKVQAMKTYGTASLITPVFLLSMWLASYTDLATLVVLACVLIVAKTIYEITHVILGRDWEMRANDRVDARLYRNDPTYARYAMKEAQRRVRDEEQQPK